ncbi:hypothetical protein HDE_04189 [Halotydeus destructor]|nr:hypothetical protein HDE_04189 [Halotydeus destructor]
MRLHISALLVIGFLAVCAQSAPAMVKNSDGQPMQGQRADRGQEPGLDAIRQPGGDEPTICDKEDTRVPCPKPEEGASAISRPISEAASSAGDGGAPAQG